jgi:CPA1 family monovalent cation:H+ antiporter
LATQGLNPREAGEVDALKRQVIQAKRTKLAAMRRSGTIDDDVFHVLEEELDWAELGASHPGRFEVVEG